MPLVWKYRHFTEDESWGDSERMNDAFLRCLDEFRHFIGIPVRVLCGTQGEHAAQSKHYIGCAADITFPELGKWTLFELYLAACRFGFTGIGIYPHWREHGEIIGGLHLERAPETTPMRAFWIGVREKPTDKQTYVALSLQNLVRYGLIKLEAA
jgi:hypothetical protein